MICDYSYAIDVSSKGRVSKLLTLRIQCYQLKNTIFFSPLQEAVVRGGGGGCGGGGSVWGGGECGGGNSKVPIFALTNARFHITSIHRNMVPVLGHRNWVLNETYSDTVVLSLSSGVHLPVWLTGTPKLRPLQIVPKNHARVLSLKLGARIWAA